MLITNFYQFSKHRRHTLILRCVLIGCFLAFNIQTSTAKPLGASLTTATKEQHFDTLQLPDHLQLTVSERKDGQEWYELGLWPLIGAVAALILTNAVAVGIVYLQSSKAFKAALQQRKIDSLSSALNEFYNPLLALIDINREIFIKTGPPSFPEEEVGRDASALVWRETKKNILENNQQIEAILKTKTHFLHATDSFEQYHALMIHVAMYETFQKIETDAYSQFLFPKNIRGHIAAKRDAVITEFKRLSGGVI